MRMIRRTVLAVAVVLAMAATALAEQAFNEDYFTTSDGVKIHYLTAGSTGSWVVLIHGYSDNAERMWFRTGIAPAHREEPSDRRARQPQSWQERQAAAGRQRQARRTSSS